MSRISSLSPSEISLTSKKLPATTLAQTKDQAQLKKAAVEFEGYFMDMVMQSMRATVDESNTFGDSQQTKLFQGMLDTEFTKISSQRGTIGLADAIIRQMTPQLMQSKKAP